MDIVINLHLKLISVVIRLMPFLCQQILQLPIGGIIAERFKCGGGAKQILGRAFGLERRQTGNGIIPAQTQQRSSVLLSPAATSEDAPASLEDAVPAASPAGALPPDPQAASEAAITADNPNASTFTIFLFIPFFFLNLF